MKLTIEEATAQYIYELQRLNKSPHTIKQYGIDLRQFVTYAKELNVTMIKDKRLQEICLNYEQALKEKEFAPTSIRRKVSSLRSFIRFLEKIGFIEQRFHELIVHNESWEVDLYVPSDKEIRDIYYFYRAPKKIRSYDDWLYLRNRSIVQTMADTGLKVAQMKRMQYGHLDEERGVFSLIQRDLSFKELEVSSHTWQHLRHYLEKTAEYFEFEWTPGNYVWFGQKGWQHRSMSERSFERIVQRATATLGSRARGSELRYFRLLQEYVQTEDLEKVAHQLTYEAPEPAKERLNKIFDKEKNPSPKQ